MSELSSILNDDTGSQTGDEGETQETQEQQTEGQQATGEQQDPAAGDEHQEQQQQEDPNERRIKGMQAATAAERTKRQQAEARATQLEQELAQLRQQQQHNANGQQQQRQTQATQADPNEPKREDFGSDAEYLRAAAKHIATKLREEEATERQRLEQEQQATQRQREIQQAADKVVEKGRSKYRDFDAVINDGLGPFLTPEFREVLMVSDRADEVAYFLGSDPLEAERISKLPPARMLHALGLIEARLPEEPQGTNKGGPSTLTQARNAQGQFQRAYSGPTPLDDILHTKT